MKRNKGFSLIELLAVLVILALLVMIISGAVIRMINNSKKTISDVQKTLVVNAAEKWSIDNSHVFDTKNKVCVMFEEELMKGGFVSSSIKNSDKSALKEAIVYIVWDATNKQFEYEVIKDPTDANKVDCGNFRP